MKKRIKLSAKNKKMLTAVGVAVLIAGFLGYRAMGQKKTAPQYLTTQAKTGTLVVSVSGSGQVLASNQTNIEPQVSGTVIAIPTVNNERVAQGQVLFELDPTNDERSVRDAKANLQSAQLALQTLEAPATAASVLQDQEAVAQANQSLSTDQSNLSTNYTTAYGDISTAFINLSTLVPGLNNLLYDKNLNPTQEDVYAYADLIQNINPNVASYSDNSVSSYAAAYDSYNQNLADYENSNVNSSTSTIETLLGETNNTLKDVSITETNLKALLDLVNNTLTQNNDKVPASLTSNETTLESYITTTNSELSTIADVLNSLSSDKQGLATARISAEEAQAALNELQNGPTELDIETKQLAVTQAQNALADAEQNLNYDTVRAPFAGVITNITAKIGQPAGPSGALGVLLSDKQLAQATLNEIDVVHVKVGQKAMVTFDALPNFSATGTVSEVDTLGTVSQGIVNYNVQVALDESNPLVKPGMSDNLTIITNEKKNVLLVPNSAITTRGNASYAKTLGANGQVIETPVVTGLTNDRSTEIVSGLSEGQSVITQIIASPTSGTTPAASTGTTGFRGGGLGGGGGAFLMK